MKKVLLAGVAALVFAGSTAAYADHRGWFGHGRHAFSAQDRSAFADAKIAAVKAGLQLTPDQERLWPPVEAAVKDMVKLRIDRAEARMKARNDDRDPRDIDPVARLRDRAEQMAATAAAMKKVADAADPLYKSLDDGQKRRLRVLTRMEGGGFGWHHHGHGFMHRDRDDGDDRGPRWERGGRGPMMDRRGPMDDGDGPSRL
uniref:LTXXQ motif family protein n=1 Tax=Rhodopseudomonas palustris (strain DX-1) TaxID=652103 RepID=E6VCW0_RHOPX